MHEDDERAKWNKIYRNAVRRGNDHGYAAYLADRAVERKGKTVKNKSQRLVLKEDFVVPAGTVFECIDGSQREFVEGNYEALIALDPDHTVYVIFPEEKLAGS